MDNVNETMTQYAKRMAREAQQEADDYSAAAHLSEYEDEFKSLYKQAFEADKKSAAWLELA